MLGRILAAMTSWQTNLVTICTFIGLLAVPSAGQEKAQARLEAEVPRIESVVPAPRQPHQDHPTVIWYDDFDGPDKDYGEASGDLDAAESHGVAGKSLACVYKKGSQGTGNRKVFFGDSPAGSRVVWRGRKLDQVYWRIYVKHQPGWTGGGEDKLSRATSLASDKWAQAMIAHVWTAGESLTLDPASGIRDDRLVTRRYNDFDRLHWLGNKPASAFKFSSAAESGWWVCVEAFAKLNTPGRKDGVNKLWIDGRLEAERDHLDWRGNYSEYGINAVFLEAYWNRASPMDQTRWLDNFVISTEPIGPVVCPPNPVLIKTVFRGSGRLAAWEVELAQDGRDVIWRSNRLTQEGRVTVDAASGEFCGVLAGQVKLATATHYSCRVRQQAEGGPWSDWSAWHQHFVTGK